MESVTIAVDDGTPHIRNITLHGITARRARSAAGALIGLPESPLENITLSDIRIDTVATDKPTQAAMSFHCPPTAGVGLIGRHLRGLTMRDVHIAAAVGPAVDLHDHVDTVGGASKVEKCINR